MSDQTEIERKRRERASLAEAFSRRAWRRGENPKPPSRVLAGALALVVAAAVVFGIGALISYQRKSEEKERDNRAALHTLSTPSAMATPSPSPSRTSPSPGRRQARDPAAARKRETKKPRKEVRRLPQSVNFSSVKGVRLKNLMTGLCAKATSDGASMAGCDPSSRVQRWDLLVFRKSAGPGDAALFTIRSSATGKCLDLPGYGSVIDTYLGQFTCAPGSGDNQTWYLRRRPGDQFWIRNLSSKHQCLDVDGQQGKLNPGGRLRDAGCRDSDDHQWTFL